MATIDQNLQRIQTVHTDMANSVTNKFGYALSSGNGFEQIADKLGDISTDINTQLASLLGNFTATISVTTIAGASVTATLGQSTTTVIANNQGIATINVDMRGTYSIQATISNGSGNVSGISNISQVEITTKNETKNTTVYFASLTINIPSGSTYTVTDNTTTYSGNSRGTDITYYLPNLGTWNVSCTDGTESANDSVTVSDYISYSKTLQYVKVYGVLWDRSSLTTLTRTDESANFSSPHPYYAGIIETPSSPFDNLYPWSEMTVETFEDGNVMVKIPKFYYKITNSSSFQIQIATGPKDGFKVSPAHKARYDGDTERDYVYVGRYKCDSSYKSLSEQSPKVSITRATARSGCRNVGSGYYQQDFAMYWTIRMLYIVEFANWNSQSGIGMGGSVNNNTYLTGSTDSMPYHTGRMNGSYIYANGIQYRNIEDLWANVYEWVDGIYFNDSTNTNTTPYDYIYIIDNPNNFSDSAGGTKTWARPSTTNNYISNISTGTGDYDWVIYPGAANGRANSYIPDMYYYYKSGVVLYTGGTYFTGTEYGLFFVNGSYDASFNYSTVGTRLMYLPPTN